MTVREWLIDQAGDWDWDELLDEFVDLVNELPEATLNRLYADDMATNQDRGGMTE